MRIILYTGKGGVGKTSVAAATGLRAAQLGHKTLVMSTDPAHSLGDSLDIDLSGGAAREVAPRLWAQELDVFREIDVHWGKLQEWLRILMAWRGLDDIIAEEMAVLPGMEELSGLLYLLTYYDERAYDCVIVDCAPTGETLRLLSFPEVMSWWLQHIFPIQRVATRIARPILRRVTDLPVPDDAVFDAAQDILIKLERMRDILTDPKHASVRLVMNPEKMVIKEAQRTYTYLNLYGYCTDLVVVNRMLPDEGTGGYFERWRESQSKYLDLVREAFAPLPILTARLMRDEVVGIERLDEFGEVIYGEGDPTSVMYEGTAQEIRQEGDIYVLSLALPFVSKEDIELIRMGDELVVHVGNQKRNLILPRALLGAEQAGAKMQGDRLEVRFRKTA
ncbi:MAG: ArsA family ATPase [Dehalococcoidia bacterium]